MTRFLTALSLVSFIGLAMPVGAKDMPRTIFALDVSGSSTFLIDQMSANAAGAYVENYVAGLDAPHELMMTSVGDAGLARRIIDIRATVTENRASGARKLAPQFGNYFRAVPWLFQRGKITAQDTTSLIGFLQSLEPICAAGKARVVVFSDGLEWSAAVDGRALATGKKNLPKPQRAFLKGCDVQLLGVGQVRGVSNTDVLAERLIPQWRAYLKAAGAETVTVIGTGFSF